MNGQNAAMVADMLRMIAGLIEGRGYTPPPPPPPAPYYAPAPRHYVPRAAPKRQTPVARDTPLPRPLPAPKPATPVEPELQLDGASPPSPKLPREGHGEEVREWDLRTGKMILENGKMHMQREQ